MTISDCPGRIARQLSREFNFIARIPRVRIQLRSLATGERTELKNQSPTCILSFSRAHCTFPSFHVFQEFAIDHWTGIGKSQVRLTPPKEHADFLSKYPQVTIKKIILSSV